MADLIYSLAITINEAVSKLFSVGFGMLSVAIAVCIKRSGLVGTVHVAIIVLRFTGNGGLESGATPYGII